MIGGADRTSPEHGRGQGDARVRARRAGELDRHEDVYARRRREQARRRANDDRRAFDPRPPDDADWTVGEEEGDGLRRVGPPTPVGDALQALLRRRGWHERLRGASLWTDWTTMVGPDLAERCEPVRLAGGTLVVRAESQVWATQLRYLTGTLADNAARLLGEGAVARVQIVVGPLTGEPEA